MKEKFSSISNKKNFPKETFDTIGLVSIGKMTGIEKLKSVMIRYNFKIF